MLTLKMMSNFLITEQKQHLNALGEILRSIEGCGLLAEIDPAYHNQEKEQYILQYAMRISQLAQTVFAKGVQTPNAILIGALV